MKPILSLKVFPLSSEMGENTMEKIENDTFSFLSHSTGRIVTLYFKKKIWMRDKTVKQIIKVIVYDSN